MIDDLDRTLEALLKRELPPDLVEQVTISFATPDDQFPPSSVTLPAIDLFLYDMRENRELRSNEWLVERQSDGTATKKRPPVRLDCSYLITAWASQSSTTPAQDEHHLLGEVMKVLLRHPTIPDEALQGSLRGQEPPLPASILQPGLLQSLGEFWQALGGKPKAALHYTVTIGVEVHKPVEAGPPVRDTMLKFRHIVQEE
jgi:Pvc16 N-terminal domain